MPVTIISQTRPDRNTQIAKLPPDQRTALEAMLRQRVFEKYQKCAVNLSNRRNNLPATLLPGYWMSEFPYSPPRLDAFVKKGGYFQMSIGTHRSISDESLEKLGDRVCRILDNLSITDPDFRKSAGIIGIMYTYQKKGTNDFIAVLVVSKKLESTDNFQELRESLEWKDSAILPTKESQIFIVSVSPATDDDATRAANFLSRVGYANVALSTFGQQPQKRHAQHAKQKIAALKEEVGQLQERLAAKESKIKSLQESVETIASQRDRFVKQNELLNATLAMLKEAAQAVLRALANAGFGSRKKAIETASRQLEKAVAQDKQ